MASQNLSIPYQDIDERLSNIGTPADSPSESGSLHAKVKALQNEPSLHDLWLKAGATHQADTDTYTLNGLAGLTKNDMSEIFNNPVIIDRNGDIQYRSNKFRTNIVASSIQFYEMSLEFKFYQCGNLEVVKLSKYFSSFYRAKNLLSTFYGCKKLRDIITIIEVTNNCNYQNAFRDCYELQNVKIKGIAGDISFENSPLLTVKDSTDSSLGYMVENAANTEPITITLHPDAFIRLEESLIQKAQEKQISIASA